MNRSQTATAVTVNGERTEMPRPLKKLPELPDASAIRTLRAAAKKHLGMSDRAAGAMSTLFVHPEVITPQIEHPRQMRIPGANLKYVEGLAWTPRLMADPVNPRNASDYAYPMAAGSAAADSGLLSVELTSATAELAMTVESRERIADALRIAMGKTRHNNTPYPPISEQGIMDAPFGVMTEITFADGTSPVTVPLVREGSTRVSHAHEVLGLEPEDTLFRMPSAAKPMKDFIESINELVMKPASDLNDLERAQVRCATVNFILIVGVEEDIPGTVDLGAAIKVKVAQEHLNTKMDWSFAAQSSAMADDCLAAAFDAGLLSDADEYRWLQGSVSRTDALAVGYGKHADDRFARALWLFTTQDPAVHDVVRQPIAFVLAKEPGRKSVAVRRSTKMPLAGELIARELRGNPRFPDATVDRIIKVLVNGAALAASTPWDVTGRSISSLKKEALLEMRRGGAPGAAGVELAMRALYFGALHDTFRVPRNDKGVNSDRRPVSDLLADMLGSEAGVEQLAIILEDGRHGRAAVLRDDDGNPVPRGDGQPMALLNETLRYTLFPKGGRSADEEGDDPFLSAQRVVAKSLRDLKRSVETLELVQDDDGVPLVNLEGLAPAMVKEWRHILDEVKAKLEPWYETGVEHGARAAEPTASAYGVATSDSDDEEDASEEAVSEEGAA